MKEVYISPKNSKNKDAADYLMTHLFNGEEVYVLWYKPTGITAVTSNGYVVDVTIAENQAELTRERIGFVPVPQKPVITLYLPSGDKKYIELREGDTYDTFGSLTVTRASGEVFQYFGISFEISGNTSLLLE